MNRFIVLSRTVIPRSAFGLFYFFCAMGGAECKTDYTIVPIGLADPADPASVISASSINDLGVVVGGAYFTKYQQGHAIRWFKGTVRDLGSLSSDSSSDANGVNNHDEIVGVNTTVSATSTSTSALVFPSSGGIINLGALMQGNSTATAINDSGAVVGYNRGEYAGAQHDHAFLYQGGTLTMLPPPETTGDSFAVGINNSAVIIGLANFGSMQTGAIYEAGQWSQIFSPVSKSDITSPTSINNLGWVVGTFRHVPAKGAVLDDYFLYKNGTAKRLYFRYTLAQGPYLNDEGLIVASAGGPAPQAFIYQSGKWINLDTLHSSTDGWHVEGVLGINNNGVILARGTLNGSSTNTSIQLVPST